MVQLRRVGALVAATTLAVSLSACANHSAAPATTASGGTGVALVKDGTLTVCTHLTFKPFEFKDESGQIVGFDMDLMDLVANDLGVKREVVDIDFNQITSGAVFAAKKCDVGAGGTTITDERKKASTFSEPYFDSKQALLVKTDSDIKELKDLKGKVLAVQTDTSGQVYAEEHAAESGYTVRVYDDAPTTNNAVLGGNADAALNDNGVELDFAKANPQTTVSQQIDTEEKYGFNVGNDNAALATKINDVLAKAKGDGTYNDIYKKWFGVDSPHK